MNRITRNLVGILISFGLANSALTVDFDGLREATKIMTQILHRLPLLYAAFDNYGCESSSAHEHLEFIAANEGKLIDLGFVHPMLEHITFKIWIALKNIRKHHEHFESYDKESVSRFSSMFTSNYLGVLQKLPDEEIKKHLKLLLFHGENGHLIYPDLKERLQIFEVTIKNTLTCWVEILHESNHLSYDEVKDVFAYFFKQISIRNFTISVETWEQLLRRYGWPKEDLLRLYQNELMKFFPKKPDAHLPLVHALTNVLIEDEIWELRFEDALEVLAQMLSLCSQIEDKQASEDLSQIIADKIDAISAME